MLWLLILLALIFAFLNGYRDSSSILAGVIVSKSLPPRLALLIAGAAEFAAPFLFGVAVAKTVATGVVDAKVISLNTVITAIAAALGWTLIAWLRGIPSSSSHALVGGLIGAALAVDGFHSIAVGSLWWVILPLFIAPLIGLGLGYLAMRLIAFVARDAPPKVNLLFQRLQVATMVGLALSHSANDAQKSMGIITLGLLLDGRINAFQIPVVVVLLCAASIALGAARGDWRLIRTLGRKIYVIRPINALASQSAAAVLVMTTALLGAPVSTSQVISMAMMGAGAAERVKKVHWQVGGEMLLTWVLTMPATMLIAAGIVAGARAMDFLVALMSHAG